MKRTTTFLASTPFLLGACSLTTQGPPKGHEAMMTRFNCTESMATPILDLVVGVFGIALVMDYQKYDDSYPPSDLTGFSVAWGGVFGTSAVIGLDRVTRCREALRDFKVRKAEADAAAATAARRRRTDLKAIQKVLITGSRDTLMVGDRTQQLIATAYDSTGAVIVDKVFMWSSSNETIAFVTTTGLVWAMEPGTAVITANAGNVVGTANVVVR